MITADAARALQAQCTMEKLEPVFQEIELGIKQVCAAGNGSSYYQFKQTPYGTYKLEMIRLHLQGLGYYVKPINKSDTYMIISWDADNET